MSEQPTTNNTPDPAAPPAAADPAVQPAKAEPSLLATPPAADPGAAPQQTPEQKAEADKAAAESKVRTDAFAAAAPEAKKAAYEALTKDEKIAAFKAMDDAAKKALGVEDPALPVYTEFKLPEGMTLDEGSMKQATDLFKSAGLDQETAQKFIDLATSREQAAAKQSVQTFVDMQNKWVGEIKADPEIGGEKLEANIASVGRLIDRLNIPDLKDALNLTGAGNNPAVVKAFVRLAQMIAEDRFETGHAAPDTFQGRTPNYYGDTGPKQSADA
jgi:hypothetical protein